MTRLRAKLYMYMGFKIENAQRTKHMLWGEVSVAPHPIALYPVLIVSS